MKEFAEIEATARGDAPAPESNEPARSLSSGTADAAAGEVAAPSPARKPTLRAKPATAVAPARGTEREQTSAESESRTDDPDLSEEQVTAISAPSEPDETQASTTAEHSAEDSESRQAASSPEAPARFTQGSVPRVMPRPMAPAETFAEGDYVVYPTHGVGRVEKIATEEIAGHKLELIHITFEENRMTLRVPVAKARTAGLRKLATRHLFDRALDVLRGRARVKRTMWSRRAQEYEAKINSGDPLSIAEVVRDLHRNAGQPDQSFSERQIYESAMDRLAAELAALDRTDKAAAAIKLAEFLKTVG
jgi:CarD family transcriptional regulator, regulator of rRNA transcription